MKHIIRFILITTLAGLLISCGGTQGNETTKTTTVCVVINMEVAENNEIPLSVRETQIGTITYDAASKTLKAFDADGTIQQEETYDDSYENALISVEIPTDAGTYVLATEITVCGGQMFYAQELYSMEEWQKILEQ